MTPEEFETVKDQIGDPYAILDSIQDESKFERWRPAPKGELRTCSCGNTYYLKTPYEDCNPTVRDLCDECIIKLSGSD